MYAPGNVLSYWLKDVYDKGRA